MANIDDRPFEQVMVELERERNALLQMLVPVTFEPDVKAEYTQRRNAQDQRYEAGITSLNNTADELEHRLEEQGRRLRKSKITSAVLGATTIAGLGLAALCYYGTGKGTTQPAPPTPAPAATVPATPAQVAQYKNTVHAVAKGEVLERIALKYGFDGRKIDEITTIVANFNSLQPNAALNKDQEVRIPYNTGKGYSEITVKAKGGENIGYLVINAIRDYINRVADANGLKEDTRAISTLGVARANGWNVIQPIGASTAAEYNKPNTLVVVEASDGERGDSIKPGQEITLPDHYSEVKPATPAVPQKGASAADLYKGNVKVASIGTRRIAEGLDGRASAANISKGVCGVLVKDIAGQSRLSENPALRRFYSVAQQYFETA